MVFKLKNGKKVFEIRGNFIQQTSKIKTRKDAENFLKGFKARGKQIKKTFKKQGRILKSKGRRTSRVLKKIIRR